ncbi:MAG TPA: hypothetical protein VER96_35435 [Polyangiaceae bacterium]|nr:hypothetical protein [Polyangiaceae bacterium]
MRETRAVRGRGVAFIVLASIGCGGNHAADRQSANGGAAGVDGGVSDGGTPGDGGAASVHASGGRGHAHAGASSRGGDGGMSGSADAGGMAGAAGATAGVSGMAPEDDSCPKPNYDYCIPSCFEASSFSDTTVCMNGVWACNPGYMLASRCPAQACRVTQDACCNSTTGVIKANPCGPDGLRAVCPDDGGATSTYPHGSLCVPQSLTGQKCISLDKQPCAGPAYYCFDSDPGFVKCTCSGIATDSGRGEWNCSAFIGG